MMFKVVRSVLFSALVLSQLNLLLAKDLQASSYTPDTPACNVSLDGLRGAEKIEARVKCLLGKKMGEPMAWTAADLENLQLDSGEAETAPWSAWYWPTESGFIAAPYRSSYDRGRWNKFTKWPRNYAIFQKRYGQSLAYADQMSDFEIAELSPSEKYDILMGDLNFSLTQALWKSVKEYGESHERIFSWEGICHGWSPAAIQVPRPEKTVVIPARNGHQLVTFYPEDIKALATQLWANSLAQDLIPVEGFNCTGKRGNRNPAHCFETDVARWHLTLVNVMGVERRSFVIDHRDTPSVANQPLHSYSIEYFNPKTKRKGALSEVMLLRSAYKRDPHAAERSPETHSIVGVDLRLTYVKEHRPLDDEYNDEMFDVLKDKRFIYDLELDVQGRIIGGQWRNKASNFPGFGLKVAHRPDFYWVIPKELQAHSVGFFDLTEEWNAATPVPASFDAPSRKSVDFLYQVYKVGADGRFITDANGNFVVHSLLTRPQPLSAVVYELIRASRE